MGFGLKNLICAIFGCILQHYVLVLQYKLNQDKMSTAIRISDKLVNDAKLMSKIKKRSLTGQIEYWALIGKIAEENPDMPYLLIREIMVGTEEIKHGEVSEYQFR